jgi:hypothetical protein
MFSGNQKQLEIWDFKKLLCVRNHDTPFKETVSREF